LAFVGQASGLTIGLVRVITNARGLTYKNVNESSQNNLRWYALANAAEVDSPALVVYPARVEENIRRMIAIAGGPQRLRPHVKTHKMSEIVRLQVRAGIRRVKCATLAEAEMSARAGASDVLLAHQPVGPKIGKLLMYALRYPSTRFSAIVDDRAAAARLSETFAAAGARLDVLLDLDVGMGRTGIRPGPEAAALYGQLTQMPGLAPRGLHAYDGQIHDRSPADRRQACEAVFAAVLAFRAELAACGYDVSELVAGGTPTFPFHAEHADRQFSPGTCLLWDAGYAEHFPDLDFLPAAVVISRVISRPAADRLSLDLGHKAVAADPTGTRVVWPDLPDAEVVMHNEEHLTLRTAQAANFAVGDVLYGIPWHICPTCALHAQAVVALDGRATGTWRIDARDRM
jgi:D-serine deaminase-like pyridoxal phosphate-dependent protein